jgi:hypothetical protein
MLPGWLVATRTMRMRSRASTGYNTRSIPQRQRPARRRRRGFPPCTRPSP